LPAGAVIYRFRRTEDGAARGGPTARPPPPRGPRPPPVRRQVRSQRGPVGTGVRQLADLPTARPLPSRRPCAPNRPILGLRRVFITTICSTTSFTGTACPTRAPGSPHRAGGATWGDCHATWPCSRCCGPPC